MRGEELHRTGWEKKELQEREKLLENVIIEAESKLKKAPDGKLRYSKRGKRIKYFCRRDPKDSNGQYIKKKDIALAEALAQKDYYLRVLKSVRKELDQIKAIQGYVEMAKYEDVFSSLTEPRRILIHPLVLPDDQYIDQWLKREYKKKPFPEDCPDYYTSSGIRVRSKSEILIAESLERNRIPFLYEYPLNLKGMGWIHPDFTVLNVRTRKEIIWEHLGMMDDPVYVNNALGRIEKYTLEDYLPGESLILTYESASHPLNTIIINKLIKKYLL